MTAQNPAPKWGYRQELGGEGGARAGARPPSARPLPVKGTSRSKDKLMRAGRLETLPPARAAFDLVPLIFPMHHQRELHERPGHRPAARTASRLPRPRRPPLLSGSVSEFTANLL